MRSVSILSRRRSSILLSSILRLLTASGVTDLMYLSRLRDLSSLRLGAGSGETRRLSRGLELTLTISIEEDLDSRKLVTIRYIGFVLTCFDAAR